MHKIEAGNGAVTVVEKTAPSPKRQHSLFTRVTRACGTIIGRAFAGAFALAIAIDIGEKLSQAYVNVIRDYAVHVIMDKSGLIKNAGSGAIVDVGMWSLQASLAGGLIALSTFIITPILYRWVIRVARAITRLTIRGEASDKVWGNHAAERKHSIYKLTPSIRVKHELIRKRGAKDDNHGQEE